MNVLDEMNVLNNQFDQYTACGMIGGLFAGCSMLQISLG